MKVEIILNTESDSDTSLAHLEVRDFLLSQGIEAETRSADGRQDLAAILTVVLGSAFAVTIAKGIAERIAKYRISEVDIQIRDKRVVVKNVREKMVPELTSEITAILEDNG